jgi:hypothetical protein
VSIILSATNTLEFRAEGDNDELEWLEKIPLSENCIATEMEFLNFYF